MRHPDSDVIAPWSSIPAPISGGFMGAPPRRIRARQGGASAAKVLTCWSMRPQRGLAIPLDLPSHARGRWFEPSRAHQPQAPYPAGNRSTDRQIAQFADAEGRVVITKDRHFRDGQLLARSPQRLLVVAPGQRHQRRSPFARGQLGQARRSELTVVRRRPVQIAHRAGLPEEGFCDRSKRVRSPQVTDPAPRTVVLRGLLYVIVCYVVVQVVQLALGNHFEWFGAVQLWIAVVVPALVTIGTLLSSRRNRRTNEHSGHSRGT